MLSMGLKLLQDLLIINYDIKCFPFDVQFDQNQLLFFSPVNTLDLAQSDPIY